MLAKNGPHRKSVSSSYKGNSSNSVIEIWNRVAIFNFWKDFLVKFLQPLQPTKNLVTYRHSYQKIFVDDITSKVRWESMA